MKGCAETVILQTTPTQYEIVKLMLSNMQTFKPVINTEISKELPRGLICDVGVER